MKKALFLLFCGGFLFAQNSELFSNDWYISKIVTGGQTVITPMMDLTLSKSDFVTYTTPVGYAFNSRHFNSCQIEATFSGPNTFTRVNSACTLGMYGGNNVTAVNSYDQKHTDFYIVPTGTSYQYEIVSNGTGKTLIVTNPSTGNQIYYSNVNAILAAKEANIKQSVLTFANPVKDNLTIENIENNLSVEVINMLGQKVYEGKTAERKVNIDTQNFTKGQYILILQGQKSQKFIKE